MPIKGGDVMTERLIILRSSGDKELEQLLEVGRVNATDSLLESPALPIP